MKQTATRPTDAGGLNAGMTFVYFTPSDIQVPRVDRQCIVYFCEAMYRRGVDLELVTLGIELLEDERRSNGGEHPLAPYRIRERFPVRTIRTGVHQREQDNRPVRWGLTRLVTNASKAAGYLWRAPRNRRLVFFAKNYGPAVAFLLLRAITWKRLLVLFEAHVPPKNALQRWALRHVDGVVANTYALAADLVRDHGVAGDRVIGTHQGIDLDLVEEGRISREEARRRLGFTDAQKLVVYAGKIFWGYREVEYLLEAARNLPDGAALVMVGGRADHVRLYRERLERHGPPNVLFTGFVAPVQVQAYLAAADVLVMYYPSGIALNRYRSPGKLFEYMAAERPIVTADYPVLREVLGDPPAAVMVPPDAPDALAVALRRALDAPAALAENTRSALQRVRSFSWDVRAVAVLELIERRSRARWKTK